MRRLHVLVALIILTVASAGCLRIYDADFTGSLDTDIQIHFKPYRSSGNSTPISVEMVIDYVIVRHFINGGWETRWEIEATYLMDRRPQVDTRRSMVSIRYGERLDGFRQLTEAQPLSGEGIYCLHIAGTYGKRITAYFSFDERGCPIHVDPKTIPSDKWVPPLPLVSAPSHAWGGIYRLRM